VLILGQVRLVAWLFSRVFIVAFPSQENDRREFIARCHAIGALGHDLWFLRVVSTSLGNRGSSIQLQDHHDATRTATGMRAA